MGDDADGGSPNVEHRGADVPLTIGALIFVIIRSRPSWLAVPVIWLPSSPISDTGTGASHGIARPIANGVAASISASYASASKASSSAWVSGVNSTAMSPTGSAKTHCAAMVTFSLSSAPSRFGHRIVQGVLGVG
jgi:hypothetical protein